MDDTIYVFGHKNPDTDTICAAIAYAHLKNMAQPRHVPARLGEINRETAFVLERFGVPTPVFLPHVYVRAQDVMTQSVTAAHAGATVHEVGELMSEHRIHTVPVLDESGHAQGIITESSLARGYLKELALQNLSETPTALGKIADTLSAQIVLGDPNTLVRGNVIIGAMNIQTIVKYIAPGDLVIIGNRDNAQEVALSCNISCLVISGGHFPSPEIVEMARARGAGILVTPHDTFGTARLINLSVPAATLMETDVLTVSPDSLINEVTPDLLASRHGVALVNDARGKLVGILTKSDVAARRRHQVILVDHSERSQSAEGIDRADILEILDHHRLGGLETSGPILAMIVPVGSTSTLVLRRYREMSMLPPREMAGLLVAAILSDTMLLKSPTTTPEDIAAVRQLGHMLGQDPLEFGREMYNAKFDMARLSPAEIATSDLKTFVFGNATAAIAQVEVGDMGPVLRRKGELLEAMSALQEDKGYDLMMLMVTDIFREGTELLAVGRTRAVERAYGGTLQDHSIYLPGVLSRKKQIVPPLAGVF